VADLIRDTLAECAQVLDALRGDDAAISAIELLAEAFRNGNRAYYCGNGGSMCDAMHFAEELSGRFRDDRGNRQERVYDVAWSGDREPGSDGQLLPVGSTVDIETATWSNNIGAPELITVWEDPDFNPDHPAGYYARVLEIPTPRWTAYEQARFGVRFPDYVPLTTQERAYTSPIRYAR
jgi:hypothetical protein